MTATATPWTVDEVIAIPEDGRRHELVDGVHFVNGVAVTHEEFAGLDRARTPSPSWGHQRAVGHLAYALGDFCDKHSAGMVMIGPADLRLTPDSLVGPDVFVVPNLSGRVPREWEDIKELRLVVEVLSPNSARLDRVHKRRLYQGAGVLEYWIVDADGCVIERWRPGDDRPEIISEQIEWHPQDSTDSLVLDIQSLLTD